MLSRKHIYIALALALFALLIRLVFLKFVNVSLLESGDQRAYWTYAQGIAAGLGFHSSFEGYLAFRPPLYSYFLAGIFRLYGENIGAVFLIQASLGAAATYWLYLIIVRLVGEYPALFGGLCFAISPPFLLYTKQIMTE